MENSIEKIVERINELYHKKQTVGLTAEETEERTKLFEEYRVLFRQSLRSQLNNIDIEYEDGTITNLGEKFGNKDDAGNH